MCLDETLDGDTPAIIKLAYDDDDVLVSITPDDELDDYMLYFYGYFDDGDQDKFSYEEVDGHDDEEVVDFRFKAEMVRLFCKTLVLH